MSNRNIPFKELPPFIDGPDRYFRKLSRYISELFNRIYRLTNPDKLTSVTEDHFLAYHETGASVDSSAGDVDITLPDLDTAEVRPYIVHKSSSANTVNVLGTINGSSSLAVTTQYETKIFIPTPDYWTFL